MNSMIQDVSIGGYIPGDSLLHDLIRGQSWPALIVPVHRSICDPDRHRSVHKLLSGVDAHFPVQDRMEGLVVGLAALLVDAVNRCGINMVFNSGGRPIIVRQWELPITVPGLHAGLTLSLQLLQAIILSMILTFTTTPRT